MLKADWKNSKPLKNNLEKLNCLKEKFPNLLACLHFCSKASGLCGLTEKRIRHHRIIWKISLQTKFTCKEAKHSSHKKMKKQKLPTSTSCAHESKQLKKLHQNQWRHSLPTFERRGIKSVPKLLTKRNITSAQSRKCSLTANKEKLKKSRSV